MTLATGAIHRNKYEKVNAIQHTSINVNSYKVIMYMQKLHSFCNTSSPDDGPRLGWKYLGNNKLWKVYQPIPTEHHNIDTITRKD